MGNQRSAQGSALGKSISLKFSILKGLNNKDILMNRLIIYDSLSGNIFLVFIFTQGAALGYVIVPFQGTKIHD